MLGFRLNKLGAAMRNGLDLRSLYGGESYGFLPYLNSADHNRQTYNAPATTAASAGDPVGMWMPQAPGNASVTNLLLWTDSFDNAAWGKYSAVTVTANVAANPDGVPTADLLTATGADGVCSQDAAVTAGTDYTFSVYLRAASNTTLTIYIFNASFVTLGSAVCNVTSAWQRFTVAANSGANTTMRVAIGGGSTFSSPEAVYASKAQLNLGSTALDYQPNAGSLGGSNRRTGGSNMLLWTQDFANSPWDNGAAGGVVVTSKTATAPNGTQTADTLDDNSNTTLLGRAQPKTIVASTNTYTGSVYLKANTSSVASLRVYTSGGTGVSGEGVINLSTGDSQWRSGVSGTSLAVTSIGNGWYRFSATITDNGTANTAVAIEIRPCFAGTYQNTPDATAMGSVYAWGAMLNIGSTADTYCRNMDQLGGLLQSAVLFQSTSADRGTRARRPASGVRNLLLNNMMTGGSAPSTYPTGWSAISSALGTITATLAYGTDSNGNPYLDVALVGTSSGTGYYGGYFATATTVNAVSGNTVTNSVEMKLQAGALTNVDVRLGIDEQTSAGAYVTGGNNAVTPTSTQTRLSYTRTLSGGGTVAYARPSWLVSWGGAVAVNITLRFVLPQCEKAAAATAIQKVTSPTDITESGQPDVWHTLWDGTSDFGTFGVQSFGSASLFAAAGQAWTVWGVFRTLATGSGPYMLLSKSASSGNSTFFIGSNSAGTAMRMRIRGAVGDYGSITLGQFTTWAVRWDGSSMKLRVNSSADISVTVGSIAEESADMLVSAQIPSAPANFFNGHNDVAMVDRALSDAEMAQLMSNLNATYRAGL